MTRERRTRRKGTRGDKGPCDHPSQARIAMTPPLDLARLRARDPELLAALVRELSPQLLAVIRGYARDDDHADELLQECWVHILERLDSYRARGPFAGWAVAVTRNVCSSSLRRDGREGRGKVALDELIDVPGDTPDADARLAQRRLRTALFKALGKLPDREREAIVLRVLEGRSTAETAEALGVSRRAVGDLVQRGLYRMRRMRGVGHALEAWLENMS
ncbi:MAG: sigma-70 family RNA polymerase sigma factor [Gemmatimonadetes bacterium]|nr:sigma-70 family RNA polymerase sigma factor [Gemmatimonadota bacterium]MYE69713.1 sigma-70 family RNA polymerase sigma factor [Gemmatimonadota bacterium]MYJ69409.1 sigma-70 family RNA polymerase sigma factor [Gemmatimonadota bacterium]